jgi:hypothetical protein
MNRVTQIVFAFAAVGILVGVWLTAEVDFPFLEHKSNAFDLSLVPSGSYDDITTGVSQFLWGRRSLDLVSQSFVVMAAVICCLAMLKVEGRHR